jgi:hypothetical protein
VSSEKPRSRISTPKPKPPPLSNWPPKSLMTMPGMTTLAMTTHTTTARAKLLILVIARKMKMKMMERRLMLLV